MDRVPRSRDWISASAKRSAAPEQDPRRALPSVDRLLRDLERGPGAGLPRWALAEAVRVARGRGARARRGGGSRPAISDAEALRSAASLAGPRPAPGRECDGRRRSTRTSAARSSREGAAEAIRAAAAHYSRPRARPREPASAAIGSPASATCCACSRAPRQRLAVNNCAAAVLLALDTFARGREVVVSRGELVEIGGSFRVPEILGRAGVKLVEVGTTNRTHARRLRDALGPATGLLLKVHRWNFEQRGFVAEVALADLVALGSRRGVPVVEDLGRARSSTCASAASRPNRSCPSRLATRRRLVCFSGDKLLGGPQAGIVLGAPERVSAMRKNPLARALRARQAHARCARLARAALLDGRARRAPDAAHAARARRARARSARPSAGRAAREAVCRRRFARLPCASTRPSAAARCPASCCPRSPSRSPARRARHSSPPRCAARRPRCWRARRASASCSTCARCSQVTTRTSSPPSQS